MENGYYWIRFKNDLSGELLVALYHVEDEDEEYPWYICGNENIFTTHDVVVVSERLIPPTESKR